MALKKILYFFAKLVLPYNVCGLNVKCEIQMNVTQWLCFIHKICSHVSMTKLKLY